MSNYLVAIRQLLIAAALVGAAAQATQAQCTVPAAKTLSTGNVGEFQTSSDANGRPSTTASGDTTFSGNICDQSFSDDVWDHFVFDESNWDNGRGFTNFCDVTRMLGRTYVGIWVAMWSSPNPSTTWDDMSGNALRWGSNYAAASMDELDGTCSWPGWLGLTTTGDVFVDEKTEISKGGVYRSTPANRAATLVHEARHADAEGDATHNGNDGTPRCPAMTPSTCDEVLGQNWDSNARANSLHIWFTSWYLAEAINTTTFQKDMVRANSNAIINNRFDTHPGFTL